METLDFSRNENVDLGQLILSAVEETTSDRQAYLKYDLGNHKMIIKGNKKHLSRSIANVLENAFKYNMSPEPVVEISLQRTQKSIQLSIKDNGLGIADEYKERIFEQFFRVPTGDIHTIKGYGLGLNYVKKVILQHQGAISVTDNYPNGTEFIIHLPIL